MKKILIVDDAAFSRMILKQILESEGYQIIEADSGTQALELLKTEKPDIITIDLLMPDMDGMELLKKVIEADAEAKAIIISTDKQKFRQKEAKEIGALAFIPKPVDPEEVLDILKNIINEPTET